MRLSRIERGSGRPGERSKFELVRGSGIVGKEGTG